ncbi:MAG: polyprenyl diphosphate synthase [Hyphomicrobiales bacterium]
MQSNLLSKLIQSDTHQLHVGIIMDGNGRWAEKRSLSRSYGHKIGAQNVRKIVSAAQDLDIDMLTLYAFSSDNWKRPKAEVSALFELLHRYICAELATFVENDIRLVFIGRRDRLPHFLVEQMQHAEDVTASGSRMTLRIALDYSSRHALISAISESKSTTQDDISKALSGVGKCKDVDLLIRTGGEQRLSDFMLWECAYAELIFSQKYWPDFSSDDLQAALNDFTQRNRRFGGLPQPTDKPENRNLIWGRG